ncbi:Site-specific recombinase XerD [Flavobacterium omnivorum]|uniref:Site-specific recombinase XerD n=1 Tax=Flavobacterium omnivorum TaxID=178355 RepID=A0A1G7ZBS1_9FLAO|nr:site-specific integrase [Flavobacterium omnivorum]SDH06065.1 Site-specific recombinase XerD [Flavobacterium omnivorum]
MNKTFNLLFFIKKSKIKANGTAPIYLRITIDGVPKEIASKRYIEPSKWDNKLQKITGISDEVKSLNRYLKTLEQEVYDAHHNMMKDKTASTSTFLKAKLQGTDQRARMLIPIFQDHNNKVETLVGQEFAPGTLERYKTSLKHTVEFIQWKYSVSDIDIKDIDHSFITEYEFFLRSVRKCANNTAIKYIKNFKKIVKICISNGWLDKDPFANYKSKIREVERDYLTQEEVQDIYSKEFATERLNLVKDIFVFSCFTGLAYIDVKNLTVSNISMGIDGGKWIFTHRQKTETASRIPLLPIPEELLLKYANHPQCINEDKLLPILSNQKMNSYLKEIADVCGINKDLTFHIARHTFATTVTLTNGVPIESVSKMLGHKSIKTTQHYAKILDKKVSEDMDLLKSKLRNFKNRNVSNGTSL